MYQHVTICGISNSNKYQGIMEVTVKNDLNVREGAPSVTAPSNKYLTAGTVIEVDGQLYKGEMYDGIDTWMKDAAGNYYWSGALNQTVQNAPIVPIIATTPDAVDAFSSDAAFPVELIDWNGRVVKLPPEIRNNFGSGITIGVLDSGIEKQHLDLAKNLINSVDFTGAAAGDMDMGGHGTEMASLIAACAFFPDKGIMGIAPQAKICSAKVMYDENDPGDYLSVQNGLNHVLANNVDIVNMSIGRPPLPVLPAMQAITDKITQATYTIFFAATKENTEVVTPADLLDLFPASCPNVIPVCALTEDFINNNWNNLPAPLVIVPLFDSSCCSINYRHYYFQDSGSSIATALVSGITALLLSSDASIPRNKQGILAELQKYTSTVDEAFNNPGIEVHIIVKI